MCIRSSPFLQQCNGFRSRETLNCTSLVVEMGTNPTFALKVTNSLAILRLRKPVKSLIQVGRHRDSIPGPPECESRALPRSHLARYLYFCNL